MGNPFPLSPHLWWWMLTVSFASNLEREALTEYASQYSWTPYPELVSVFLKWAALASTEDRRTFLHGCRDHVAAFGDKPVAALDFMGLVGVILGTERLKPVLLRAHVLHWLSTWAATMQGKILTCAKLLREEKDGYKVGWSIGPSTLTCCEWQSELTKQENAKKIVAPDARTPHSPVYGPASGHPNAGDLPGMEASPPIGHSGRRSRYDPTN